MKERFTLVVPLAAGLLLCGALLLMLPDEWLANWRAGVKRAAVRTDGIPKTSPLPVEEKPAAMPDFSAALEARWREVADQVMAALKSRLDGEDMRPNEALISFKSEEAYRAFLERANAAGLKVLGKIDSMLAVRVGYDSLESLQRDIMEHAEDYGEIGGNYYVHIPPTPDIEERAAQTEVGFGDRMLEFLGVTGDNSPWGKGVTIAVLDSGIAADSTFGEGRVRHLDLGLGTAAADGHGTAVGALAAGAAPDAKGVAPAANLLSVRVTGDDGYSDIFTLSEGIMKAVDGGAHVINISLGAYQTSSILTKAIGYATDAGVLVVAAAGNDQASTLTWPAADPRVISVGAVDALEQQVTFSNSGDTLQMTAPGYGIHTAWLDNERIVFDGTSASAPVVAGAIAAMMSQNPGMSAAQAWEVLKTYSSDGGEPGADRRYGNGILNLGWAMDAGNPGRYDPAVSSQYYNPQTGAMEVVLQNRGGQGAAGLKLEVDTGSASATYSIPWIAPGGTHVVAIPIDNVSLNRHGAVSFNTRLVTPANAPDDQVLWNNRKSSTVFRLTP